MSELDAPSADRGTALAATAVLGPALDEIRWQHPEFRVLCGAFRGPAVQVVVDSRPKSMASLDGVRATGEPAAALADLLQGTDELVVPDVREHAGLRATSPEILGQDTLATAIVPLRVNGHMVGFLRLDGPRPQAISRIAIERLHDAAQLASLALALEHERSRSQAHISHAQQLRASICRRTVQQREAGTELRQAMGSLRGMVERVAPRLEPATRIELGTIVHRFVVHLDAAADTLTDAAMSGCDDNAGKTSQP